jgi:bacterioferritin
MARRPAGLAGRSAVSVVSGGATLSRPGASEGSRACHFQFRLTPLLSGAILLGTMKGSAKVIAELNKALREELTAINQYFLHAEMCENWGYDRLSEYIKKQSIGEMKHAEALIERILFLEGTPSMQPLELTVGKNVQEMMQSDLDLELSAVKAYNAAIQIAVAERDNGSRDLLVVLLKDEEDHVDWLEAQMHQIKELGYERYLTMQMGEFEEEE